MALTQETTTPAPETVRPGLSWRWVHVTVAALAMVATLPGRTHGLGLITEPLLADLRIDRVDYAAINLWATLLGALFCLPCGGLIDRLGTRLVLAGVSASLGVVVVVMSRIPGESVTLGPGAAWQVTVVLNLFVLVLLTRGLGQSALSVVSLTLVGRAGGRRSGPAIGVYSFLCALGFMVAFAVLKKALEDWEADWRELWEGIGVALLAFAVLAGVLVRPEREQTKETEVEDGEDGIRQDGASFTLGQALRTPAFWVFALATSLYGMIAAGVSLFNESILAERYFDRSVFLTITVLSPLVGLASNLATGWVATRRSLGRLMAAAMAVLATALLAFPLVRTLPQVYLYAATLGIAGGMVTVIFFAVWGQAFGPAHLGKIQGAAQMLTVLASAAGPLLLASCQRWTGSYVPLFRGAAVVCVLLALAAWWVHVPGTDHSGGQDEQPHEGH